MTPKDIFAGPIIRRAEQGRIAIWLATRKWFDMKVAVRPIGNDEWTGHSTEVYSIRVFPTLYVFLAIVTPKEGQGLFPTGRLLEYSIAVPDPYGDDDRSLFDQIVQDDGLAYPGFARPAFYLQEPGQKLCALYASCRKIHGHQGGRHDALTLGDDLIVKNTRTLSARPAILCLTGDQIYADDVHDSAFDEVIRLARELTGGQEERLPKGRELPGKRHRADFVTTHASFTSGAADNHLVTLAEYVAMYGLAWSRHNWSGSSYPPEVQGYLDGLPKVRRMMANTPTYMIFDDHDVTDDWNLSLQWKDDVWAHLVGRRIVANALYGY